MSEIRDKIKRPYTEISTLLSEYLVIQVQECIKSHALTDMSGNAVYLRIHVLLLIYQKGLIYLVNRPKKLSVS